jgi:hypothetical protein
MIALFLTMTAGWAFILAWLWRLQARPLVSIVAAGCWYSACLVMATFCGLV